jgi:hypothetical protein
MKKIILVCSVLMICELLSAQSGDFRNVVSFNVGANAFGLLSKELKPSTDATGVQYKYGKLRTTPTYQLAWDYGIAKWFSAGLAGSYNSAKYTYDEVQFKGQKLGAINLKANRTTLSLRLLFHYGNRNNWDFYSGGRLGVGFWSGRLSVATDGELTKDLLEKVNENLPNFVPGFVKKKLLDDVGARAGFPAPQLQFIPIGVRGYFNDHIGLNAELAIGSPYYFSGGLNYRF